MKICSRCKESKPLEEFPKNKRRKDGHNTYCKPCHKAYVEEHYQANRQVYLDREAKKRLENPNYNRDYKLANRSRYTDLENKRRAMKRNQVGKPYNRQEVFDADGWVCYLCDEPIDPAVKMPDMMCASIDHVKPISKGGLDCLTNVRASHLLCNVRKNATFEEEEKDPNW